MSEDGYVLRPVDRRELERLEHQHRVWKEETDRVVASAGFGTGDRLVDLGCGPGFLTFDLAAIAGPSGSVLAIDNSSLFIGHLRNAVTVQGPDQIRTMEADLQDLKLDDDGYDGAICRWVLMFLPRPEDAIANVARAIRPGGAIAIMEYVHFRSISLWPDGDAFRRVYDAVAKLIARSGGDADIGGRIPGMLARHGFEIVDLIPIWRTGRPGSPLWQWLDNVGPNHENLVANELITRAELDAYHDEWNRHANDPTAFIAAPPVLATIARKR